MRTNQNETLRRLLDRYVVPPAETAAALPSPVTVAVVVATGRGEAADDANAS